MQIAEAIAEAINKYLSYIPAVQKVAELKSDKLKVY
jgi:hypothetical protein